MVNSILLSLDGIDPDPSYIKYEKQVLDKQFGPVKINKVIPLIIAWRQENDILPVTRKRIMLNEFCRTWLYQMELLLRSLSKQFMNFRKLALYSRGSGLKENRNISHLECRKFAATLGLEKV